MCCGTVKDTREYLARIDQSVLDQYEDAVTVRYLGNKTGTSPFYPFSNSQLHYSFAAYEARRERVMPKDHGLALAYKYTVKGKSIFEIVAGLKTAEPISEIPPPSDEDGGAGILAEPDPIAPADGGVAIISLERASGESQQDADVEASADSSTPSPEPVVEEPANNLDRIVSPAAAKLADEQGVDISTIVGTGKKGTVLKSDVQNMLNKQDGA